MHVEIILQTLTNFLRLFPDHEIKLKSAIKEAGLNETQLRDDMNRDDVEKMIKLSSFLAGGSGARGTPAMFINDIFTPGYLSRGQIEGMLMAN